MGNPIMGMLGGMMGGNSNNGGGGNQILMKAFGAMMRGESPQQFLKSMAQSNPQMQGYNFDDLEGAAKKVCNDNGKDFNNELNNAKNVANNFINK